MTIDLSEMAGPDGTQPVGAPHVPRYVVSSVTGFSISPTGQTRQKPTTIYYVLDRGNQHFAVTTFRPFGGITAAMAEARAREAATALNAGYGLPLDRQGRRRLGWKCAVPGCRSKARAGGRCRLHALDAPPGWTA